ncbi:oxalate/formate MFS antiporter, partial [Caballeronia sp. LZ024]|nr:oxalate/formate MFS antiporter [Caballeronia sp. LZ024]
MANTFTPDPLRAAKSPNRWAQLVIGIICMGLVANLQYAWTLFVVPMDAKHHWGQAA